MDRKKGKHPREEKKPSTEGHTTPPREARCSPREEDPPKGTAPHHTKAHAPSEDNPSDARALYQATRPTQARHNTQQASQIQRNESHPPATSQPDNPSPHKAPARGPHSQAVSLTLAATTPRQTREYRTD